MDENAFYEGGINDLRSLLRQIGRHEFRAFGYANQIRAYRRIANQA